MIKFVRSLTGALGLRLILREFGLLSRDKQIPHPWQLFWNDGQPCTAAS